MITGSPELDNFVVEPWMKLEPFDPKLIKKLLRDHPYKILLKILYDYYPSYSSSKINDTNLNSDSNKDVTNLYFKMLDDYTRYGIAFQRKYDLLPGNKLGVIKSKDGRKTIYYIVDNHYDKKTLLFNNVKTIDLNEHDTGKKPLSKKEKLKRGLIKKIANKKLQVALMEPDVYNNDELFKDAIEKKEIQKLLIKKFNHYMTYDGYDDFLKKKY